MQQENIQQQTGQQQQAQNLTPREQEELITLKNQVQGEPYGQRTTDTFQLSDVFVQFKNAAYEQELKRFFDLVFCNPYITPTQHEHGMFLAYASSLRSGQLGRQVGAAILSQIGDVLAVGCNDVPRPGGGLYWPGGHDRRDHILKCDKNDEERSRIAWNLISKLSEIDTTQIEQLQNLLGKELSRFGPNELKDDEKAAFVQSICKQFSALEEEQRINVHPQFMKILDITEYGRAVHGEMDALLSCARNGVSPKGATLYATTFPCHNCTRHIIAAGIKRVYYIEPYAKSRAEFLHEDAIVVEEKAMKTPRGHEQKLPYTHFVGVGPRRYFDLFSLSLGSGRELLRKNDRGVLEIERRGAWPRVPLAPDSYLLREENAIAFLELLPSKQLKLDI